MTALRTAFATLVLLGALGAAILFAPAAVGGRMTYAWTSGDSMSPAFQTGDLIGLRRGETLRVGDVGGYRDPETGNVVVHRVVAEEGDRLTFKGDNNWWVDSYRPTRSALVGKVWIHVEGGGAVLDSMSGRWPLAAAGGFLGITVVGAGAATHAKARRAAVRRLRFAGEGWQLLLLGLVALGIGSSALAGVALQRNTTESVTDSVRGRHTGAFTYEGNAFPSPVYEGDVVRTGQPIFVDLVPRVTATFLYELEASGAEDVRGTIRLFATTRDINGWERTLDLVPTAEFVGTHATASTEVDLVPLMELASAVQRATGATSRYLTTAITAEITVSGTLSGQAFTSSFSPFYTLRITPPNEVFVETSLTRDFESVPPVASPRLGTLFMPIQDLSVPVERARRASMSLLFVDANVDRVRSVSLSLAIISWLGAIAAGWAFAWALRSPAAHVHARYGNLLVHIARVEPADGDTIRVESMGDLVRIAQKYQAAILWFELDGSEVFIVRQDRVSFVHRCAA